jgi:hypothetical protein
MRLGNYVCELRNLPWRFNDDEVVEWLYKVGALRVDKKHVYVPVTKDGMFSAGRGFVDCQSRTQQARVLKCSGKLIDGRDVQVRSDAKKTLKK